MVDELLPAPAELTVGPHLGAIAAQAEQADQTRSIDSSVMADLKASEVVRLAASPEIGGPGASIQQIGRELEATAGVCTSTAWVLWNHLAVFHLFVGCLGPDHRAILRSIGRSTSPGSADRTAGAAWRQSAANERASTLSWARTMPMPLST